MRFAQPREQSSGVTTIDAVTSPGNADLFARAYRSTGYARFSWGPLARGELDGRLVELHVPVDQVIAADVRLRAVSSRTSIVVAGPDGLTKSAQEVAQGLCDARELTGDLKVTLRSVGGPTIPGGEAAAAGAVVDALAKVFELMVLPSERAQLLTAAGLVAASVHEHPALLDTAGAVAATGPAGRVRLVALFPQQPSAAPEAFGTLSTPGELGLPQWLTACAGGGDSAAADLVRAAVADEEAVRGVVGGHYPTAPVLCVLGGEAATVSDAQRLSLKIAAAVNGQQLPGGRWRVHTSRTARPTD